MTRTHDLLITNQLHYRLCYTSANSNIILDKSRFVKPFFEKKKIKLQNYAIFSSALDFAVIMW